MEHSISEIFTFLSPNLEWKSSVKLSIMTERRQRQGFAVFINKESFPFGLMDGIWGCLGNL